MKKIKADRADKESPEWTAADFRRARPALEVISEAFSVVAETPKPEREPPSQT